MLNANKIRWMTRASIYEKEEGTTDLSRNSYYASDYVRYCLLKNFISVTVAAFLILAIYCLCRVEYVMTLAAEMNLGPFFRQIAFIYAIAIIIYTAAGIVLYTWQYHSSRKRLKTYYRMLKMIERYGQEDGQ